MNEKGQTLTGFSVDVTQKPSEKRQDKKLFAKEQRLLMDFLKQTDSKKYYIVLALVVLGVFILLYDDLFTAPETAVQQSSDDAQLQEMAAEYELQLTQLISQVQGAGNAVVMVTMESGIERRYAKDEQTDTQSSSQEGGADVSESYASEYILIDGPGGEQMALVEVEYEPALKGVAVLCEGGGDLSIVTAVTELVSVVTGLPTSRVFVGELV